MLFVAADKEGDEINNGEIKERGGKHWDDVTCEIVATANVFCGHVKIVHTDHANDGGFLNDSDDLIAECWNNIFDGLWCNDFEKDGGVFQTESEAGFGLTFVYGQDATTNDFRAVGGGVKTKGKYGSDEFWKIANRKNDEEHNK